MQLISPEESVNEIQRRLPNDGRRFRLRDAVDSLHDFYVNVRYHGCNDDDDSLVAVAGKFGDHTDRRFDIGLYRSFGLTTQLEILLRYPINLRCLFLKQVTELCESPNDAERFFATLRSSRWYRRFASISAHDCIVRLRGEDEMGEMFCNVIPKLMDALGPHL
jgi:hypothetical protein